MQLYLVFAARAADTVAAALLRTAALYLAGEGKVDKLREASKGLVATWSSSREVIFEPAMWLGRQPPLPYPAGP